LNTADAKLDSPFQRASAVEAKVSSVPSEKMEQMIDPLQAMLLDMVLALCQNRAKDMVPPTKVEKDVPGV
jgi:DNA ligase 4